MTTSATVPAVRMDDVLDEHGWQNVRFIKLDVEGHEVRAIRGMNRLLSRPDAPLVYFESNKYALKFYDETHESLKSAFRDLGYKIYKVESNHLIEVPIGADQAELCTDYLAAKTIPESLTNQFPLSPPSPPGSSEASIPWVPIRLLRLMRYLFRRPQKQSA